MINFGEEVVVAYSDIFPEKIYVVLPKRNISGYTYIVKCPGFRE
jgi:hypothetical protein